MMAAHEFQSVVGDEAAVAISESAVTIASHTVDRPVEVIFDFEPGLTLSQEL